MQEKAEEFWKEKEKSVEREKGKRLEGENVVVSSPKPSKKINLEGEKVRDGLAQLILTVVELLRELMEKQAMRRIEAGSLTGGEIENLGVTFMSLKEEIKKLKEYFNFEDEDLDLDLGPLVLTEEGETGKASIVEILDRLLAKGVVVRGDVVISVANVDLVALNLGLLLASIDKAREMYGGDIETKKLEEEVRRLRQENERLKNKRKL